MSSWSLTSPAKNQLFWKEFLNTALRLTATMEKLLTKSFKSGDTNTGFKN